MKASRMIPLLFINYPAKRIFVSTIDINVKNINLNPYYNYNNITGINFIPRLLNAPDINISLDPYNPRVGLISLDFEISNQDRYQDYEYFYPFESADVVFIYYDIDTYNTIYRVVGKMVDIKFNKQSIKFTLQDSSTGTFIDQPSNVLKEDTFQTVHTFGPFSQNPLSLFGLLVDYDPGPNKMVNLADWPPTAWGTDDIPRSLCVFIQHPSLYNKDDLYWVGSLVSIIEDPIPVGSSVMRSGFLDDGVTLDPESPYQNGVVGWPSTNHGANCPLLSKFCLGASAYVVRNKTNKNAKFSTTDGGRIWFDTLGPDMGLNWAFPAASGRLLPFSQDPSICPPGTPARWRWANRSPGAIAMGDIAQRHVIRIWRRCLPENSSNVGSSFQIAYGSIKRGLAIHAIGGKAIGDAQGAGNDYYIFCSHPIAHRFAINRNNAASYLKDVVQFPDIKIWHSLDEFVEKSVKDLNPYIYNKNEYEAANNPFPRRGHQIFDYNSNSYLGSSEFEPCVYWFVAGEDAGHRYPLDAPTQNRQTTLIDNYNNPKTSRMYTGFRLRGDEYWSSISALNESAALEPEVTENTRNPVYWLRNGLGSSNVYVDFNGWPDFDDGWLTGLPAVGVPLSSYSGAGMGPERKNPAGLITNPADIIAHFLLNYTRLNNDRNKIDWNSFRKTKGQLFNWKFSSFINESNSGSEIISRWLAQCRCTLQYLNDKFYLNFIDLSTRRKINYMFRPNNIERNSFNITKRGIGGTFNKFKIRFKYYAPHDTWENSITYDASNNRKCALLQSIFNATDTFEFDCQDIRDYKVAKALADYFVDLYAVPRNEAELVAIPNDSVRALMPGDLVVVQHPDLQNVARLLFPNGANNYDSKQYFTITQANITEEMYKFKLLQLHPENMLF